MLAWLKWGTGKRQGRGRAHRKNDAESFKAFKKRTPGFPDGIAVFDVAVLIESQQDTIKQIVLARGLGGKHNTALADALVMQPVRRLASLCHLLPASKGEYFNAAGGLFEMCLEIALLSILAAEQRILTRATPEIRQTTEELWTHAAFLTGLFSEAVAVLSMLSVFASDGDAQWNPSVSTLYEWLVQQDLPEYRFQWDDQENRPKIHVIASQCIDTTQVEILAKGDWFIFNTLLGALHNPKDFTNPLAKINDQVKYKVIERDLKARASNYGKPLSGMHLQPWLIDAMRALLLRGKWQPNTPNGRVWHGTDGVYLVWPLVSNDIKAELREAGCPFVPTTSDIMAEMMVHANIISPAGIFHGYSLPIKIPHLETGELRRVEALKLSDPLVLFPKGAPEPMDMAFADEVPQGLNSDGDGDIGVPDAFADDAEDRGETVEPSYGGANVWDDPDYASYAAAAPEVSEDEPLASPPDKPRKNPVPTPAITPETAAGSPEPSPAPNESDWLAALTGTPTPEDKPEAIDPSTAKAAVGLVLAALNSMPPEFIAVLPDGLIQFQVKGFEHVGLELHSTVSVLKQANLLVLSDGFDTGVKRVGNKPVRFILVKELAHGR